MPIESSTALGNFSHRIRLALPTPADIVETDVVTLVAGCDKQIDTCHHQWNNTDDFRGDPYLPGMDNVVSIPNSEASP